MISFIFLFKNGRIVLMIKQALIAAGSFGTRMSAKNNPKQNKSLIKYAGQTMIGHLIDSLKSGGVKNFIIASGYHNYDEIRNIVAKKDINAIIIPNEGPYRKIAYQFEDLLDDRFLFVCGHQPLSVEFVKKILKQSLKSHVVIAAYDSAKYPLNKSKKIIIDGDLKNPKLKYINSKKRIKVNYMYIRNPYIVSKNVISLSRKHNFKYSFSYYIFDSWKKGKSLGVVEATMPPEFDYDFEYEWTKKFLKKPNE